MQEREDGREEKRKGREDRGTRQEKEEEMGEVGTREEDILVDGRDHLSYCGVAGLLLLLPVVLSLFPRRGEKTQRQQHRH